MPGEEKGATLKTQKDKYLCASEYSAFRPRASDGRSGTLNVWKAEMHVEAMRRAQRLQHRERVPRVEASATILQMCAERGYGKI